MKYKEGNIVLLYEGQTVYILSVDKQKKVYCVIDTDNTNNADDVRMIKESQIYMLVT